MTFDTPEDLTAPEPHRCAVSFHDCAVRAADGHSVQVRVYEPKGVTETTLVWAHGGSWTRGSIADWHEACLQLVRLGKSRLVSVGYRLAPRWEHPTAVLDIACALRWSQHRYGGSIYVGGDSAGGTLAAGAALHSRDSGFDLAGQILVYPPLDPDCTAPSYSQPHQPFPPQEMLIRAWKQYAGAEDALLRAKYLAPIHEDHLAGICRTALLVGPSDPVRDDVRAFAKKLKDAAVLVSLCEDAGVFHGQFLNSSGRANPVHQWVQSELEQMSTPTHPSGPAYTRSLLRHFADLRDGTHGDAVSRKDKEALFFAAVDLLRPYAVQVLGEVNETLLLGQGAVGDTGVIAAPDAGRLCSWTLSWDEQRSLALAPINIHAYYGRGFHHPHLRGGTVQEWPMNVFTQQQAADEVPLLRSIAAAELHNLVFAADFTIVPASKPGTTDTTR